MTKDIMFAGLILTALLSCSSPDKKNNQKADEQEVALTGCCASTVSERHSNLSLTNDGTAQELDTDKINTTTSSTKNMIFVPGGEFNMGARDANFARADEYPVHRVKVNSFYMDPHPVTNAQFRKFIEETGYITTA